MKLLTSTLVATLSAVIISGCGRQPDAAPATASPATPPSSRYDPRAADGACVLSRSEVSAVLGAPIPAPAPRHESTIAGCLYSAGPAAPATASSRFLSIEFTLAPETLTAFTNRTADSGGTRIRGIGDAAYFIHPVGASSRELAVHTGSTSLLLELQLPGGDDAALLNGLQGLAAAAVSSVPA